MFIMDTTIVNLTSNEFSIIENNKHIKYETHPNICYTNVVCVKPWGHEFLILKNSEFHILFL